MLLYLAATVVPLADKVHTVTVENFMGMNFHAFVKVTNIC